MVDREYPQHPICAVGAVVRKGDAILLIRRGKPPRMNEWSIPGGAVELGETLRAAAKREVAEECGIEVSIDQLYDVLDIIEREPSGRVQYHYAIVDFLATYAGGELCAGSDVSDARWVTRDELDQYSMNSQTREFLKKNFASPGHLR